MIVRVLALPARHVFKPSVLHWNEGWKMEPNLVHVSPSLGDWERESWTFCTVEFPRGAGPFAYGVGVDDGKWAAFDISTWNWENCQ